MAPTCALPVDVPMLPPGALENEPLVHVHPANSTHWIDTVRLHFVLIELVLLVLVLLIVVVVLLVSDVSYLLLILLLLMISRLRLFDHQFAVAVVAAVLAPFSVHLVAKTAFAKAEKRNRLVVAGLACPRRWWRLPLPAAACAAPPAGA